MNGKQWTTGAATAAVLLSSGVTAMAQQPATPGVTSSPAESLSAIERQLILDATRGAERAVELGELAKQKAQTVAVNLALTTGLRVGDTKGPSSRRTTG